MGGRGNDSSQGPRGADRALRRLDRPILENPAASGATDRRQPRAGSPDRAPAPRRPVGCQRVWDPLAKTPPRCGNSSRRTPDSRRSIIDFRYLSDAISPTRRWRSSAKLRAASRSRRHPRQKAILLQHVVRLLGYSTTTRPSGPEAVYPFQPHQDSLRDRATHPPLEIVARSCRTGS